MRTADTHSMQGLKRARLAFCFPALAFLPLLFLLLRGLCIQVTAMVMLLHHCSTSAPACTSAPLRWKMTLLQLCVMLIDATRP